MKQVQLFQTAVHTLHKLIVSEDFMNRSRMKATDFTRNRKLDFPTVVSIIMSIMTKPIHSELCSSFSKLKAGISQPTQQSFSEARQKIHYQAFEELFQRGVILGLSASDGKTFRGYRLLAIDGSTIPLKKSDELREYFAHTSPVSGEIFGRVLSPTQEASFLSFIQSDKVYQKYYDEITILLGTAALSSLTGTGCRK